MRHHIAYTTAKCYREAGFGDVLAFSFPIRVGRHVMCSSDEPRLPIAYMTAECYRDTEFVDVFVRLICSVNDLTIL